MYLNNADLNSRQLSFEWRAVAPNCPAITYNILASNCGSCPTTTNHTTVTCTDMPINGNSCTFALETVVCGHIIGNKSDTIQAALKGKIILVTNNEIAEIFTVFYGKILNKIMNKIKDRVYHGMHDRTHVLYVKRTPQ